MWKYWKVKPSASKIRRYITEPEPHPAISETKETHVSSTEQALAGLPAPWQKLAHEFFSYLLVGGLAFIIDYGVLWLAHNPLGLHYLLATLLGFCAGLVTNYLLCITWVWRGTNATTLRDFINFALIGVGGMALTALLMWLAVDLGHLAPELAKPFIAGIVLVWNFGLRRIFVFFR